jgi:hypothetical protein
MKSSVVDLDLLNPDPDTNTDPVFQVNADQDTDPDPKIEEEKNIAEIFLNFFDQKLQFTYP